MPPYYFRFPLSSLIFAALTGCGGSGGSSGSAETTPNLNAISFNQEFVQSAEDNVFTLAGSFSKPDSVELSQAPDIGLEVLSLRDNEISLKIPSIDRPLVSALELTLVYGDQSATRKVSLLAENLSAAGLVDQAEKTVAEKAAILELTQDYALYRFFVDYAYLNDVLTHSGKQQRLAEFDPDNAPSRPEARSRIDRLATELAAYQRGEVSDQALDQSLRLAEASIIEHGRYGAQSLEAIQPFVELLVSGLSVGELVYIPEAGFYSRILNMPQYGQITEAGFQVAEAYAPVKSLIRSRPTQSLTCEIL